MLLSLIPKTLKCAQIVVRIALEVIDRRPPSGLRLSPPTLQQHRLMLQVGMWSRLFSGAIFSTSSNSGHQPDHVAASSRTPKPPDGNRGGQSGLAAVLDGGVVVGSRPVIGRNGR